MTEDTATRRKRCNVEKLVNLAAKNPRVTSVTVKAGGDIEVKFGQDALSTDETPLDVKALL